MRVKTVSAIARRLALIGLSALVAAAVAFPALGRSAQAAVNEGFDFNTDCDGTWSGSIPAASLDGLKTGAPRPGTDSPPATETPIG